MMVPPHIKIEILQHALEMETDRRKKAEQWAEFSNKVSLISMSVASVCAVVMFIICMLQSS